MATGCFVAGYLGLGTEGPNQQKTNLTYSC
jgi:hypothetical protein